MSKENLEKALLFAKIAMFSAIGMCLIVATIQAIRIADTASSEVRESLSVLDKSIRDLTDTTRRSIEDVSKATVNMIISLHGVSFDIRKNYTRNDNLLRAVQEQTFTALNTVTGNLAKSLALINGKLSSLAETADSFLKDTNISLNSPFTGLLPAATTQVNRIGGEVALVINGKVSGLIQSITANSDTIKKGLEDLFGTSNVILSRVDNIAGSTEEMARYIANVTANTADVTKFYRDKIISPSKWDRFKQIFNMAVFTMGEIVIPWAVTKKIRIVE